MSWIKTILPDDASGSLKKTYNKLLPENKDLTNIITANSLRPETIETVLSFEKSIMRSNRNKLPAWFIEALGVYVSYLNGSEYYIEHFHDNMKALLKNNKKSEKIRSALAENQPEKIFDVWEEAIMKYAEQLTKTPASITDESIDELRICGLEDPEILEITQIIAYLNFINRLALGLGVNVEDHLVGLNTKK